MLFDAIAAGGILCRVPHYLRWQTARQPYRLARVLGDGVVIGVAFAVLPLLLGSGEPSVVPIGADRLIWFAVLAAIGILNAMLVYACVAAHRQRAGRKSGSAGADEQANANRV